MDNISATCIYLSECMGVCKSDYKSRIANLKNVKIDSETVKKKFFYEMCKCVDGPKKVLTKITNYSDRGGCHCSNGENDHICKCINTDKLNHNHSGPCNNIENVDESCECETIFYNYDYNCCSYYNLYCDGTDIILESYIHGGPHIPVYTYNCGHECKEYHKSENIDEVINMHNNIDTKIIDTLMNQTCGEKCRFAQVGHEYLIDQIIDPDSQKS